MEIFVQDLAVLMVSSLANLIPRAVSGNRAGTVTACADGQQSCEGSSQGFFFGHQFVDCKLPGSRLALH